MNPEIDYSNIYCEFSSKLKKKIFRKSQLEEAKCDFSYLAKSLSVEDTPEYAAVFTLGKAKCEYLSNNPLGEAAALLESGRLFLRAEESSNATCAFSIHECLNNAVSCCLKAAMIYETNEMLTFSANVYIYVADNLMKFDQYNEALPLLCRAADIFCRDAPRSLHVLSKCANCQISIRDYIGALKTYQRIQKLIIDATEIHGYEVELFLDELSSSEIYRVLLELLSVSPRSKSDSSSTLVCTNEAYLKNIKQSENNPAIKCLSPCQFLFLKSLIMAHKSGKLADFEYTASYAQDNLLPIQRKLVCVILETANNFFPSVFDI